MTFINLRGAPNRERRSSYEGETVHGWKIGREIGRKQVRHSTVRLWECFCALCGARGEKSTADVCKLAANERDGRGQGGCAACRQKRQRVPDEERKCSGCGRKTRREWGDTAKNCTACMNAASRARQAAAQ